MSAAVRFDDVSVRFVLQHQRPLSFQDAVINFFRRQDNTSEEFWALRDISLDVQRGETVGIIGQNGSGKSTLLKLITRILEPTSGKVTVDGKVSALIELGAGFHPDLTGRENIYLNGSILGYSRKAMDRLFDEIVAFSELDRFIDTPVKHYSSGMYMRLGFSVAISVDPDILIIDEVLSVGDVNFQAKCLDRINQHRQLGKTIIFVSHGLGLVEQICDRVVWLHRGVVEGLGLPGNTIQEYVALLSRTEPAVHDVQPVEPTGADAGKPEQAPPGRPPPLELIGLTLLTADGEATTSVGCDEPVWIRLELRSELQPGQVSYRFTVQRDDGLLVHASDHEYRGELARADNGREFLDIGFQALPLVPATYELSVGLLPAKSRLGADVSSVRKTRVIVRGPNDQSGVVALSYTGTTLDDHLAQTVHVGNHSHNGRPLGPAERCKG